MSESGRGWLGAMSIPSRLSVGNLAGEDDSKSVVCQSRDAYNQAIKADPADATAYYNLAFLLENHLNNYDGARDAYEDAIRVDPADAEAHCSLGELLEKHFNNYEEARNAYDKAIAADPNHARAYVSLGSLLFLKFQNYKGAREAYERGIQANPTDARQRIQLGMLLQQYLHDYKGARDAFEEGIRLHPDDDETGTLARFNLAGLLMNNLKDDAGARALLTRVIKADPRHAGALFALGLLRMYMEGDYDGAVASIQKALEIDPANAGYKQGLEHTRRRLKASKDRQAAKAAADLLAKAGQLCRYEGDELKCGDPASACRYLKEAIEADVNGSLRGRAHFNLGLLLETQVQDYDGARDAYRQATDANPDNPEAHVALARLLKRHFGNYEGALDAYRRAIDADPGNAKYKEIHEEAREEADLWLPLRIERAADSTDV